MKKLGDHKKVKMAEYVANYGDRNAPKLKKETEGLASAEILKIDAAIESQKEVVEYMEQIIKIVLSNFSFDIKNSLDIVKIENS